MDEKAGLVLMAISSAVVVAGSVVAAGYFGFETLRGEIDTQQKETRAAVVSMKSETITAIKTAQSETVEKLSGFKSEAGGSGISTELAALKTMAETLRNEQKTISENLTTLVERQAKMADAPAGAIPMPPVHSAMASSIFYPLGVFKGAKIDEQVIQLVPMLMEKTKDGACAISVSGYSDTLGNDEKNLKLSQERADHVAAQLRAKGLKVESVIGWGERRLKVHTMDATKNEQNRRVVVDMECTPAPQKKAGPTS